MASPATHREWAKRNEELFDYIGGAASPWSDWSITTLFYAAVHEITAFLLENEQTIIANGLPFPNNHTERKQVLRVLWPDLAALYEPLERRSWRARYRCQKFGENEIKIAHAMFLKLRKEIASL